MTKRTDFSKIFKLVTSECRGTGGVQSVGAKSNGIQS